MKHCTKYLVKYLPIVIASIFAFHSLSAQEQELTEILPAFKDRALIVNITAGIMEQNNEVVWNTETSKVTIPGRPVSIKLVGENIMIVALFTPYRRQGRTMLVAQGQVWTNIPNEGMRYETTMQTMPLEFGEKIYFFPLGQETDNSHIVIELELNPYRRDGETGETEPRGLRSDGPEERPGRMRNREAAGTEVQEE